MKTKDEMKQKYIVTGNQFTDIASLFASAGMLAAGSMFMGILAFTDSDIDALFASIISLVGAVVLWYLAGKIAKRFKPVVKKDENEK